MSLCLVLSACQKVPKNSALGRISRSLLLLVNCLAGNITRPSLACRCKPFCRQQGAADRTAYGNLGKYNCRTTFGRSSHNGLLPTGLSAVLLTVPFRFQRWITFCNHNHRRVSRILSRTIVMSRKTGTVKGHNLKPVDFWIK